MKGGGGVKTIWCPSDFKTTLNYNDYGESAPHSQAVAKGEGGGGPIRTPKLSLDGACGGSPSSECDIVNTLAFFYIAASLSQ